MYKVNIKPRWELQTADGRRLPPHLIELLMAVHATGSLAGACREAKLSYRYAWGLLRESHSLFGAPLLRSTRGRGALLTPLGRRLVWADNRISARLSPTLRSLASELEVELERGLAYDDAPLRIRAPRGAGLDVLRAAMADAGRALDVNDGNADDALVALRSGACDLAGLQLPIGELEGAVLGHYRDRLDVERDRIVHFAVRRQGLIVASGNPKRLRTLGDLSRDGVRFVRDLPGSGPRRLLDCMLAREGLALPGVREEAGEAHVASVASGQADAGFGPEPPARAAGLGFVPMIDERCFFVCREGVLKSEPMVALLQQLRSAEFRDRLQELPGYGADRAGSVQTPGAAFASL